MVLMKPNDRVTTSEVLQQKLCASEVSLKSRTALWRAVQLELLVSSTGIGMPTSWYPPITY
jgi:hypothetical protein